jgi:3-oxoacyl-[acyl-carrier protein] reductase
VKLLGKVALVTGSARGLGKAAALELARAGATVIINDLPSNEALADATVDELRHGDLSADLALANVGDEAQIEALIGEIVARHGRLDILVNNAGINRDSTIRKATSADWDLVAGVNLRGPFLCTRAALNPMREQGWGRVVNVASVVGKTGVPGTSYYAAAKGGLISLTKAVASEDARLRWGRPRQHPRPHPGRPSRSPRGDRRRHRLPRLPRRLLHHRRGAGCERGVLHVSCQRSEIRDQRSGLGTRHSALGTT